jgi:hypothetical protein
MGNVAPDTVKPEPVSVAPLIVSGAVPLELSITGCEVAVEFVCTFPKARLVALTLSVGTDAFNCKINTCDPLPAFALNVAVCVAETGKTSAVKPALVAPAGTVTVAGTATAALLLARPTTRPPLAAAALKVTVQASVPAPVIIPVVHVTALSTAGSGVPVPLKPITVVAAVEESLLSVS